MTEKPPPAPQRDIRLFDEHILLTCGEMARADAAAMAAGAHGTELMEAAGRAVAQAIVERYRPQAVVVLCGPGNNGGDGFVVARLLKSAGWPVRVTLLGSSTALQDDAAWASGLWKGPVGELASTSLAGRPLVVDALFGAGLNRNVDGVAAELIDRINQDGLPVVAIDIPSGLHGDTGQVMGTAMTAAMTVTFFRAKLGHYSAEGLRRCGALRIADIGVPRAVLETIRPQAWRNDRTLWSHLLRRDVVDDHKYARGHVTILGGSTTTGAARLAALACRRIGAGLATIAAPHEAITVYLAGEPGNLVVQADDFEAFARLLVDGRRNTVLIGPGSGVNERTRGSVLAALKARRAVLLDADGITAFADRPMALFEAIAGPVLMTPHEGEFRRLFPDLARDPSKVERARQAARRSGATVLLKGPGTVIAAPDGRVVLNGHAPPSLATAGSGDVLAGMAAGLLAQGLSPLAAGAAAAWLHGECAYRFHRPGLIAEDLPAAIPEALEAALSSGPPDQPER